jgi:hypothetical protein
VDGNVISGCPSSRNLRQPAACHALFEGYQICELKPSTDRAFWRSLERSTYRDAKRREGWELLD